MSHIKEPEGVYFTIESPRLSEKDKKEISDFIRKRKSLTGEDNKGRSIIRKKSSVE